MIPVEVVFERVCLVPVLETSEASVEERGFCGEHELCDGEGAAPGPVQGVGEGGVGVPGF